MTKASDFIAQHAYEPDDNDYPNRLRSYLTKFGATSPKEFSEDGFTDPLKHTFEDGSVAFTQPSDYYDDQFVALGADEDGNSVLEDEPGEDDEEDLDEDRDGDSA